jgi:hypothetical protein
MPAFTNLCSLQQTIVQCSGLHAINSQLAVASYGRSGAAPIHAQLGPIHAQLGRPHIMRYIEVEPFDL